MNIRKEVAQATAVVNYDLIKDEVNAMLPVARVLEGCAYVGSAAAGDSYVEVMINNRGVGMFEITSTGLGIDMAKDFKKLDEFVPANARVQAIVRDAPATNPVVIYLQFGQPKKSFKKKYYGKTSGTRSTRTMRRF